MQAEKGDRMTIRELRILTKMTQKQFSEYFGVPFRTLQDWEYGKGNCPDYLLRLIIFKLEADGLIEKQG